MPTGVNVALGVQRYVKQAVTRQLVDHVVQKTVSGVDVIVAFTVQVKGHRNVGFTGFAS
jgi:hypothetical protein